MKTRNHALMAGWSIIQMAVTAGFTFGYAHSTLVLLGYSFKYGLYK